MPGPARYSLLGASLLCLAKTRSIEMTRCGLGSEVDECIPFGWWLPRPRLRAGGPAVFEVTMDSTTILIVLLLVVMFGGGGFFWSRRGRG